MAASDYVPIFFKNRLHLAGRPQMSTRPKSTLPAAVALAPTDAPTDFSAQKLIERLGLAAELPSRSTLK
jgi:hypothetical protein